MPNNRPSTNPKNKNLENNIIMLPSTEYLKRSHSRGIAIFSYPYQIHPKSASIAIDYDGRREHYYIILTIEINFRIEAEIDAFYEF